jgi:hypothetical protein
VSEPKTIEELAQFVLKFWEVNLKGTVKLYDFIARLDDQITTEFEATDE